MTFTEELYEKISNLYVGMTVRGFSELCGKSPSYYGSIKAHQHNSLPSCQMYSASLQMKLPLGITSAVRTKT